LLMLPYSGRREIRKSNDRCGSAGAVIFFPTFSRASC
jgi:hypothetical protein